MQPDLFTRQPTFDSGIELSRQDHAALWKGLLAVRDVLLDGEVHTVQEIAARVKQPEASVSANCRNLRKPKHGGYQVELVKLDGCRRFGYRLLRPPLKQAG